MKKKGNKQWTNLVNFQQIFNSLVSSGLPKDNFDVLIVDFSNQRSVYSFAQKFKSKYDALHGLVNNAGIAVDSKELR